MDLMLEEMLRLQEEMEEALREEQRREIQLEIDKYVSVKNNALSLMSSASAAISEVASSLSASSVSYEVEAGELTGELVNYYNASLSGASDSGSSVCGAYEGFLGNAAGAIGQIEAKIADLQSQYDAI